MRGMTERGEGERPWRIVRVVGNLKRDPDVIAQESGFSSLRRRVIAGENACEH